MSDVNKPLESNANWPQARSQALLELTQLAREVGQNRPKLSQNPRELDKNSWKAPKTLRAPGRMLWNRILGEYDVTDAAGLTMLELACQAFDRAEALRERIDADGEVVATRGVLKVHPAIREETSCRNFIVKSLQRLGLSFEPVKLVGRPPADIRWDGDE